MEIRVKCVAFLTLFENIVQCFILILIPVALIIAGFRNGSPAVAISGFGILLLLFKLISTTEKEIVFKENYMEIHFFFIKPVQVKYGQIISAVFQLPPKSSQEIVLIKLKNRQKWRKKFTFAVAENEKQLLEVFNFLRSQEVPTGLNKIGEKYLYFDKKENQYFHWYKRNE